MVLKYLHLSVLHLWGIGCATSLELVVQHKIRTAAQQRLTAGQIAAVLFTDSNCEFCRQMMGARGHPAREEWRRRSASSGGAHWENIGIVASL